MNIALRLRQLIDVILYIPGRWLIPLDIVDKADVVQSEKWKTMDESR